LISTNVLRSSILTTTQRISVITLLAKLRPVEVMDAVLSDALPATARPLVVKQVIAGVDQPDLQPMAQVVSDRDQSSLGPHQILIIGDRLSAAATGLKHPRNLYVRDMHGPQRVSSFGHQTTLQRTRRPAAEPGHVVVRNICALLSPLVRSPTRSSPANDNKHSAVGVGAQFPAVGLAVTDALAEALAAGELARAI
jgi:hypothetical protein